MRDGRLLKSYFCQGRKRFPFLMFGQRSRIIDVNDYRKNYISVLPTFLKSYHKFFHVSFAYRNLLIMASEMSRVKFYLRGEFSICHSFSYRSNQINLLIIMILHLLFYYLDTNNFSHTLLIQNWQMNDQSYWNLEILRFAITTTVKLNIREHMQLQSVRYKLCQLSTTKESVSPCVLSLTPSPCISEASSLAGSKGNVGTATRT